MEQEMITLSGNEMDKADIGNIEEGENSKRDTDEFFVENDEDQRYSMTVDKNGNDQDPDGDTSGHIENDLNVNENDDILDDADDTTQ